MELARTYPGATRVRAPLKSLDRLLSNQHLTTERFSIYAAMRGWLLITGRPLIAIDWSPLEASATRIVRCDRQRMQIEESFRDLKCERYSDGFELSLSRLPERIANLLLIRALATFVAYPPRAASMSDNSSCCSGVVGKRRHHSLIWLGRQLLRRGWLDLPSIAELMDLLRSIRPFSLRGNLRVRPLRDPAAGADVSSLTDTDDGAMSVSR